MNTDLSFGGCPICGGKNTLTNVGSTFKPWIECNACGSKFEQRSVGSPKYKMIETSYFLSSKNKKEDCCTSS